MFDRINRCPHQYRCDCLCVCVCACERARQGVVYKCYEWNGVPCMSFKYEANVPIDQFSFLFLCTNFRFIEFISHRFPYAIFTYLLLLHHAFGMFFSCVFYTQFCYCCCCFYMWTNPLHCIANVYIKFMLYGFFVLFNIARVNIYWSKNELKLLNTFHISFVVRLIKNCSLLLFYIRKYLLRSFRLRYGKH